LRQRCAVQIQATVAAEAEAAALISVESTKFLFPSIGKNEARPDLALFSSAKDPMLGQLNDSRTEHCTNCPGFKPMRHAPVRSQVYHVKS
jgi:hypothetical protein